jgi:hypothetical protein
MLGQTESGRVIRYVTEITVQPSRTRDSEFARRTGRFAVCDHREPGEAHLREGLVRRRLLHFVRFVIICFLCGSLSAFAQAHRSSARETGRISGVRSVLRETILSATRYSRIHDFDVYFSLRTGQETYCLDYETVVLDEVQHLASSEGKDLDVSLNAKRNKVILYTPWHRKLNARIVAANLCRSAAIAYTSSH